MTNKNELIIYDTEYTSWEGALQRGWSEPWEHREIVQIGAVKLSLVAGLPEIASFMTLVQPKINTQLSPYFIDLTGITQKEVNRDGISFPSALDSFIVFTSDAPLASNHQDYLVIAENCELNQIALPIEQPRFYNVNPLLSQFTHHEKVNSGDLPGIMGIELSGHAHNALYDAQAVAAALRHIQQKQEIPPLELLAHEWVACWL